MKKNILLLLFIQISLIQHGQIIADHTVVDKFDDIPQAYIDEVKKMWLVVAGESHSQAYRDGLAALAALYPKYTVSVVEDGTPDPYTTANLRVSRATWGDQGSSSGWVYGYGEEDWWTNATAVSRTKAGITHCNNNNLKIGAMGFGWCWDASGGWASELDPVYNVHWYGWSEGGSEGSRPWGLDDGDAGITYNPVNLDDYIEATQSYIDFCGANGYPTKVFFTTGPVDNFDGYGRGEIGYQGYLKWEHIRDYVKAHPSAILFDYADILCWDDNGSQTTTTFNGHTYPTGTSTNTGSEETGHITNDGALRLAKAMWWMLARLSGWDGGSTTIPVTGITVTGAGGATTISTDNGTLQLTASVTPSNASNKTVTWSIQNGTGQASISATGLVTAINNGTVTAKATATDGSGVVGNLTLTLSNQIVPVSAITVTGAGGANTITTNHGTLLLTASVVPSNSVQTVTWSIQNGTGQASINASGLLTAVANGTVIAKATASDGSGISGTLTISISGQTIPVTGISVTGAGGATTISTDIGTLQLSAAVNPDNASNKTVTWSIQNGTGQASISATGLVTAINNGTVTAKATANDGSGVYGTLTISISNQIIPVNEITISGTAGATTINTANGSLQLTASVLPANASNPGVTWSVQNGSGQANISTSGNLTAIANGTVIVKATANDGSGIYGALTVTISNQVVYVAGISVTGVNGLTSISTNDGTLQLTAIITPINATNQSLTWSVINGSGRATISNTGLVTAIKNGTVTAYATSNDGSDIYGTLTITIFNQIIPVSAITIQGEGGSTVVPRNGTLQLHASVNPEDASNKNVSWSVQNGTGEATISNTGLVNATTNGTVSVRATANDGSGIFGLLTLTISDIIIKVKTIVVYGSDFLTSIDTNGATLQLHVNIFPGNATNKSVTWSLEPTSRATITENGLVTAIANGNVTAMATATDGSGIVGLLNIALRNQGTTTEVPGIVEIPVSISNTGSMISIYQKNGMVFDRIQVCNLLGQLILKDELMEPFYSLDKTDYIPGVYIFVLTGKKERLTIKVAIP